VFAAVVTDKEFKGLNYNNFVRHVRHFLRNVTHQHLRHVELAVEFFTVTHVALETGETLPRHKCG
jgi:hypothetical protein